jgi:5-methylcytosine-specific restriction endonuclease McrA
VSRWDHLVSIYQGGETVLGNMVLSCAPCDNSKGKQPFDVWMRSAAPGSPASRGVADIEARIDRIRAYVAHYCYVVRPLEERLDAEERRMLADIREKLQVARVEAEALVAHYRVRTGHG